MRQIEIVDIERRENTVFVHCKVQGDIDNIPIEENVIKRLKMLYLVLQKS